MAFLIVKQESHFDHREKSDQNENRFLACARNDLLLIWFYTFFNFHFPRLKRITAMTVKAVSALRMAK